ncbi:radical SAM protein [Putridiphycobacter roseus]|uniref:Radical SAM protein n=1 Tax=Putridiphycobacter roseus TaxID=2219161 RepID=A0A2W1N0S3_9FLAO|nr:arsenosugar biosynthesis radical SAM (seleno)protein ArsS [Putridiphycobacter roseus]PZE18189.1 radical SAM protein [Putridiphycobacter roseus]
MSNILTLEKWTAAKQIDTLTQSIPFEKGFIKTMSDHGHFPLKPKTLEILQINLGYLCNLECTHCHVDASPRRKETTPMDILNKCLAVIDETPSIHTVDLTGGAPEMNPHFKWFIEELGSRNVEVLVRSNLTILVEGKFKTYPEFLAKHKVTIVSSLPCYTEQNTDAQRGDGVFNKSVKALQILNGFGYGIDPELKLHLVFNPGGASIAPSQAKLKLDYQRELKNNYNIVFNELYTITNLPISRFLEYLSNEGMLEDYVVLLANSFNPATANEVMCTNTLSVDWNGNLFDCDFNQILKLPVAVKNAKNIMDFDNEELSKRNIVVNNHCFGCTAGEGSSCQGALT